MNKVINLISKDCQIKDEFDTNSKEYFVWRYGKCNCKHFVFKSSSEIIKHMAAKDPFMEFDKTQQDFILRNVGKEVLCYICGSDFHSNADIFVYGDDNIAFSADCFL